MITTTAPRDVKLGSDEIELATFYLGELLLGVRISEVEEISRQTAVTPVPCAAESVRGVMSLRGEVVTVLDLRPVLGLEAAGCEDRTRNVIVQSKGERIGLLVDRVADVARVPSEALLPPPPNVGGSDSRFFQAVYRMERELLVILDVGAATAVAEAVKQADGGGDSSRHTG